MRTVNANGGWAALGIAAFAGCLMMCAPVMATVAYTYENDDKTYVATVSETGDFSISDEAIAVLNRNEVTNFVVRGMARLVVDKSSTFTGDVYALAPLRLSAANSLGTGPGKIYVTTNKITTSGGTIDKAVYFNTLGLWGQQSGIGVWGGYGTATFKKKVTFDGGGFNIYPYVNSRLVFEGGLEGSGCISFREMAGGTVIFTNTPIRLTHNWPASAPAVGTPDASGFSRHIIFAVAENSMIRFSHQDYPFSLGELKTTVDWAFNSSSMTMHFGHDSKWDLCGTEQRVGQFNVKVDTGNPSIITNSSATLATLYCGMLYGPSSSTPNIRFGGNLSVVFENNIYDTKIGYPMTAKGDLIIRGNGTGQADLNFLSNGSWANATNVVVEGVGKIKIANPNALGRKANVSLASNSSLEIASGVTVNVRTLTVGGVQKPRGDYTFGSGTLHVSHPHGFELRVR